MAHSSRKRILYYCQSLVGIGHLSASLRVIRELLQHYEVDLIQGGLDTGAPLEHPGYRSLRLTTLLHDSETGGFYDPDERGGVEEIWAVRAAEISGFLRWPYHAIVVEFYPFGRRRFKQEIQGLFRAVRERCGAVPIFTSVREVLVPRAEEKERRMVESVKKYIHTVFIRGDPEVVRFEETFSLAHEIEDQLSYTGYISAPAPASWPVRKKQILVSQGGGNVGRELLEGAIGAAALMPEYAFLLAAGSRTSPAGLEALRATVRSSNVEIVPFLAEFQRHLRESSLSINMGGDNTLMDVVTARTASLAYPFGGNSEQEFRIKKFAQRGFVHALERADLPGARLKDRILQALRAPYPDGTIGTNGAAVTSERIKSVLDQAHAARI
jgi:predicted glycosyltransferase